MIPFQPSKALTRVQQSSLRPAGATPPPGTVTLARGEPDFPTPEPIAEALRQAVRDGHTHYGDANGDSELRETIAELASRLAITPKGKATAVESGYRLSGRWPAARSRRTGCSPGS